MNSKDLLTKSTVILLILVMAIPTALFQIPETQAQNVDPDDWYKIVRGRLGNDTYSLYPYPEKSLDIGFSKFGEMIAYDFDTGIGVGLQYPGYDTAGTDDQRERKNADGFANERINVNNWVNGWLIDMKYLDTHGDFQEYWAMALFSVDNAGGDWVTMPEVGPFHEARPLWQEHEPYANPSVNNYPTGFFAGIGEDPDDYRGGRKTNGLAETEPIEVLYDGPRKFVALTITHLYDRFGTPLVDVHITIVFDKVQKRVILLKDVKIKWDKTEMNIQFGNRGEVDVDLKAYVHWFTDDPVTIWDHDGDGDINASERDSSFEFFRGFMLRNKYPKKWWDDVDPIQVPDDDTMAEYNLDDPRTEGYEYLETQHTTFTNEWHTDPDIKPHGYALAQAIDSNEGEAGDYVFGLAVWPHPEFWTCQNFMPMEVPGAGTVNVPLIVAPISRMLEWERWLIDNDPLNQLPDRPNTWIHCDDFGVLAEPQTPWLIYEHDFALQKDIIDHYRVVSVYAMTDYHDGDDADADDLNNDGVREYQIDRELKYLMDEIFNSWDIRKAMTHDKKRWVYYEEDWDIYDNCFWLPQYMEVEAGLIVPSLPVEPSDPMQNCKTLGFERHIKDWDNYCSFSERVEIDFEGDGSFDLVLTPADVIDIPNMWKSYPYFYEIDRETGEICILNILDMDWEPEDDAIVKVLWSSIHTQTEGEVWDFEEPPFISDEVSLDQIYLDPKIFPLHHTLIRYPRGEEVIAINDDCKELDGGQYVLHNYADGSIIFLDKMARLGDMFDDWLYVTNGTHNMVFNHENSWDQGFTKGMPYNYREIFGVPLNGTLEVSLGRINETFVEPEDVEITINEIELMGGVVLDAERLFGARTQNRYLYEGFEFEFYHGLVEIDYVYQGTPLYDGDYVIIETTYCDALVLNCSIWPEEDFDELKIVYEVPSGRYEHVVVGKDAASVDSIGAAMITAAIKNKRMEIGIGSLDMLDPEIEDQVPWVMAKYGEGYDISNYYFEAALGNTIDQEDMDLRTGLKNDWCTTFPISSASLIGVGGPIANLLTYYGNDFMDVLYGDPRFTEGSIWTERIAPITCWSGPMGVDLNGDNHTYSSFDTMNVEDMDLGYAVIVTSKDKNQTVLYNVWGHFGRDTYYASRWFDFNKFWLQHINDHITGIVLEIDYYPDSDHPSITPIEFVGTISEKTPHEDP
jgi:hypothetical protein